MKKNTAHKRAAFRSSFLLALQVLTFFRCAAALSHSILLPLTREFNAEHGRSLAESFDAMVDSTDFLVRTEACGQGECSVPVFGGDARITFGPRRSTTTKSTVPTEYVLKVNGRGVSTSDFGWICAKFFECRDDFTGIGTAGLRRAVAKHYNEQPPHTGYDAQMAAGGGGVEALLDDSLLTRLEEDGFIIIDSAIKTTKSSNEKLSKLIVDNTGQGKYRSDTVAFLDSDDAASCDIEEQFDLLMGIAAHLNDNLKFASSPHEPLSPGTRKKPLTNPSHIQAAEYGENDCYCAHSDNSLTEMDVRRNYRCYTCILYCNDGLTKEDGGALRVYHNSAELLVPADAKETCTHFDVNPINGRLIIFDSKLVHSVEKVTQSKPLTLWILRPEDSGVRGEVYYCGGEDTDK